MVPPPRKTAMLASMNLDIFIYRIGTNLSLPNKNAHRLARSVYLVTQIRKWSFMIKISYELGLIR